MFKFLWKLIKWSIITMVVIMIAMLIWAVADPEGSGWNESTKKETVLLKNNKKEIVIEYTLVKKAYKQKANGFGSTHLTRAGKTKGDDFRNCINSRYWDINMSDIDIKKVDLGSLNNEIMNGPDSKKATDFCSWHAGIGKYQ
tara:strand:- start:173 stop:598 length:426 start_codon:yes stop_codon:yes gene_type:complete